MTLASRDLMPPRTPYEAELRARVREAEERATLYERLATAQDHVVQAAAALLAVLPWDAGDDLGKGRQALALALEELEREHGRALLDSMPPALRAALTGPSILAAELAAESEPRRVAIVAIQASPAGDERWHIDFATDFGEAYEKLGRWNERARLEWPGLRFSLEMTRLP